MRETWKKQNRWEFRNTALFPDGVVALIREKTDHGGFSLTQDLGDVH
jgi:hypothetical protein